tara:strand:+ start:1442 stop:1660 length:219 start_codon:yes stop_codon:yes gene_type:complete
MNIRKWAVVAVKIELLIICISMAIALPSIYFTAWNINYFVISMAVIHGVALLGLFIIRAVDNICASIDNIVG